MSDSSDARPFYVRRTLIRWSVFVGTVAGIIATWQFWERNYLLYSLAITFGATTAGTLVGTMISWFVPQARKEREIIEKLERLADIEEQFEQLQLAHEEAAPDPLPAEAAPDREAAVPAGEAPIRWQAAVPGSDAPVPATYKSRSTAETTPAVPSSPPAAPARRSVKVEIEILKKLEDIPAGDSIRLIEALQDMGRKGKPSPD